MKVYKSIQDFNRIPFAVVTNGTFDGVHVGHQKILHRIVSLAKQNNGESVVVTFWPHPRIVLNKDSEIKLLSTIEEKIAQFQQIGIDHLLILPFDKTISELTPQEYIEQILVQTIGTRIFVIGYDHKFGKNRAGDFRYLTEVAPQYKLEIEEISKQEIDNIGISSTKIRQALVDGNPETANKLLNRNYSISGIVTKGNQIGRTIGYPTANIKLQESYKLIPSDGAYAVLVTVHEKVYYGMLNIGFRPTIKGDQKTIEVNIFDFNNEIYGENISLEIISMIRNEIKFNHIEDLKIQLQKDKTTAQLLLKDYEKFRN